jgi:hypothetical protein
MLKRISMVCLQVGIAVAVLGLTGCAYRDYRDEGRYYRPGERRYYERTDYRYGRDRYEGNYDRRHYDRYGRCD